MKVFDVGQEATGVIAIGQFATGVLAIGQLAIGVIAIGQVSRGVVAVGQGAVGVVAVGQLAVGAIYGAGMVGLGALAGGLVPVPLLGQLRFADVIRLQFKGERLRLTVWRGFLLMGLIAVVISVSLIPVGSALWGPNGIFEVPAPRR